MINMELNTKRIRSQWSIRSQEIEQTVFLDDLIKNYGFTPKDLYDLVKLRKYEAKQRYLTRYQMPNFAYL